MVSGDDDPRSVIEALHRKYAGVLFELCVRMLGDRSEAEDAVQETFVSAYRSLGSFTFGSSHLPWLYRIATNTCLKFLRTRRRKGLTLIEEPEKRPGETRDPADRIHARRVLERLVNELDERGLEIVVAHYISGMNQEQIAGSLGISRRAVVKRLTALRKRVDHLFMEANGHD